MDFSLSEAQTELAGLTRKILAERDTPERQWAELAAAGVLAAGLPMPLGGAGLGFLEQCSVLAEIGRAASPVPYLPSIVLGAGAIAEFGGPDQQRRWVPAAADGSVVLTAALSEEDGDDPSSPSARAERDGERWRLSGVKTTVPAAARADLLLVPATVFPATVLPATVFPATVFPATVLPGTGADEVLVFLVEPTDPGVSVQRQTLTDTAAGEGAAGDEADAGRLILDGVALDDSRVLGGRGRGRGQEIADWLVARGTVGLCAVQAGVTERALELTAQYARSREQFERPIGSFQAVAQRLADAYIDVEAIRLTMWQAAWLLATRPPDNEVSTDASPVEVSTGEVSTGEVSSAVATAKFWAADAGHRVAHTAVHVHGGVGIDLSSPVHRYFTAATLAEFTLGGATAHLRRLGDALATAAPTTESY